MSEEVSGSPKRPLRPWIIKMAWLGVPLVLLGEGGHLLLTTFRQTLIHHFFHIVFGIGAGIVFLIYVIQDVRHNGWPGFSWHLYPKPSRPPETPA